MIETTPAPLTAPMPTVYESILHKYHQLQCYNDKFDGDLVDITQSSMEYTHGKRYQNFRHSDHNNRHNIKEKKDEI